MTNMKNNDYCIILAGGRGRRLWPASRAALPKQFTDFLGVGRTLLQATYDRVSRFILSENILVCTTEDYSSLLRSQLPEVSAANTIIEPLSRSTAPSVAAAALRIAFRDRSARIVIVPADQHITDGVAYERDITQGLDIVEGSDSILTMGVTPMRPESGYGYIQMGEPTDSDGIYHVKSFSEKPDRDFAKLFVDSGEFLWNTGIYIANINALGKLLYSLFPDLIAVQMEKAPDNRLDFSLDFINRNYAVFPSIPFDYGVFDHGEDVHVMRCSFDWADIGTWHSVYEFMRCGEGDNVVISSEVMLDDCRDNIIRLSDGRLAVIAGLEGYIVAEQGNVLLICRKEDSSALLRKYLSQVQLRYGEDFL